MSEKVDHCQEVFTEVSCRNCYGEEDRHCFSAFNQLLTGHSILNNHKANLTVMLALEKFKKMLIPSSFSVIPLIHKEKSSEDTMKDILSIEGLNTISDIYHRSHQ